MGGLDKRNAAAKLLEPPEGEKLRNGNGRR